MRFLNPINKILALSLSLFFLCMNSYAQTDRTGITVLTPDEYTAMVLGEKEIQSPSGIYQIARERPASSPDQSDGDSLPKPRLTPQNSSAVPLSPEERYSIAYLLFIKMSVSDLDVLGVENSIKIYAHRYGISNESALSVIDSIVSINNRHREILNEIKYRNCQKFNESIEAGNYQSAVSNFIQDEKQLDVATTDFFREIDTDLASAIPGNVYEDFQRGISQLGEGVNSLEVDPLGVIEALGGEVEYYSLRCQTRLNEVN